MTKITELASSNTLESDDLFVVVKDPGGSPVNAKIPANTVFNNTAINFTTSGIVTVGALSINNISTPANSTITISEGRIFFDANYIYVATANNTLKRVALSSF